MQLPDAASLQRTKAVFKKVEAILAETEGIRTYNTIAGFSFFTRSAASYAGTAFIGLKPWDERTSADLHGRRRSSGRLNAQVRAASRRRASSPSRRPPSPASARRAASA